MLAMKNLVTAFLIFTSISIYSQSIGNASNEYDLGLSYLDAENFKMADSLITKYLDCGNLLSFFFNVSSNPTPLNDVYFNLAVAKIGLKDTCSFCKIMHQASLLNDTAAFNIYYSVCGDSVKEYYLNRKYLPCADDKAKYKIMTYFDKYNQMTSGRISDLKISDTDPLTMIMASYGNTIGSFRIKNTDTVYTYLSSDYWPKFSNWKSSFVEFIEYNIHYPESKQLALAKYKKDELSVNCNAIIDKTGKINELRISSFSPGTLDSIYLKEAMNVLLKSEKFIKPARILGRNVSCEILLPVIFKLKED